MNKIRLNLTLFLWGLMLKVSPTYVVDFFADALRREVEIRKARSESHE